MNKELKMGKLVNGDYLNRKRLLNKAFGVLKFNYEDDLKIAKLFHNRRIK
jgi:hypothetical protein